MPVGERAPDLKGAILTYGRKVVFQSTSGLPLTRARLHSCEVR
jgi:hypothetical protein